MPLIHLRVRTLKSNENSIGRLISIIYRFGHSHISRKLENQNIGRGQHSILLTLFRNGGISQQEISDYLQLDKSSIAKWIKKLEDGGYIERSVDLIDKRINKVSLTQKGLDIIPMVKKAIENWEDIVLSDLSDNEKQVLEQVLIKMAEKRKTCINAEIC